jgi:hypothetical protein
VGGRLERRDKVHFPIEADTICLCDVTIDQACKYLVRNRVRIFRRAAGRHGFNINAQFHKQDMVSDPPMAEILALISDLRNGAAWTLWQVACPPCRLAVTDPRLIADGAAILYALARVPYDGPRLLKRERIDRDVQAYAGWPTAALFGDSL